MANYRPNQLPPSVAINKTEDKLVLDQNASGVRSSSPDQIVTSVIPQQQINKISTSVQSVNGAVPGGDGAVYVDAQFTSFQRSKVYAETQSYGEDVKFVQTAGYYDSGDLGKALYKRKSDIEADKPGDWISNNGIRFGISEEKVNPYQFGAKGDSVTDDTQAWRDCVSLGLKVSVKKGMYVVTGEIEFTTVGQIVEWEDDLGYGYGEQALKNWSYFSGIIAKGTFDKRVRTRRLYRGSAADPQDAPLSCVFNIQAEGTVIIRPSITLWCDYSDDSPTNFGDDCDIGIFIGTRVGVSIIDPTITGYFRNSGIYSDFSGASNLPRFNSLSGIPYPEGTVKNGSDGLYIATPYIRGPKQGFVSLGALPKSGETWYSDPYYDEILGSSVEDGRGSFGCSDLFVLQGRIYGPEHHSNYRWQDPVLVGGLITEAGLLSEPDDSPCCVHLCGMAGNSSHAGWGIRFVGTRIATFAAFRVRLNYSARVSFYSCHIEGRASDDSRFSASGVPINANDYTATSYGDIAATSNTNRVSVYDSVRQSYADGLAPHFYASDGKPTLVTSSGRFFMGNSNGYFYGENGFDFRMTNASQEYLLRQGTTTIMGSGSTGIRLAGTGQNLRWSNGESDIRSATGSGNRTRTGTVTTSFVPSVGIYENVTTLNEPNIYVGATNTFARYTSSLKNKKDIEDMDIDIAKDIIFNLEPKWYRSKCEGDNPYWSTYGFIAEDVSKLDPRLVHWKTEYSEVEKREVTENVIVEKIDEETGEVSESLETVTYEKEFEVIKKLETPEHSNVQYAKLVVPIVKVVQELEKRLSELENK